MNVKNDNFFQLTQLEVKENDHWYKEYTNKMFNSY